MRLKVAASETKDSRSLPSVLNSSAGRHSTVGPSPLGRSLLIDVRVMRATSSAKALAKIV
eukprot:1096616-Pyramimonas_sp.AAC.1